MDSGVGSSEASGSSDRPWLQITAPWARLGTEQARRILRRHKLRLRRAHFQREDGRCDDRRHA